MKVFAKVPFMYGGQNLERGEVINLRGLPRDTQLVRLKYFIEFAEGEHTEQSCPTCGKKFATYSYLLGHKRKPDCLSPSSDITKEETAELLGVDIEKARIAD
jgi:hypothetical protein